MKKIFIYTFLIHNLTSCSIIGNNWFKSEIEDIYIPRNLNDAIIEIDKKISDAKKKDIKTNSENDFIADYYFGKSLRNSWGLWKGSRLSRYFNRKGIKHPDYMTFIIKRSYYRNLKGIDIDFSSQLKEIDSLKKRNQEEYKKHSLPKKTKFPNRNIEMKWFYSIKDDGYGNRTVIHFQTNEKEKDSLWIYVARLGWKKINRKTEDDLRNHYITTNIGQELDNLYNK